MRYMILFVVLLIAGCSNNDTPTESRERKFSVVGRAFSCLCCDGQSTKPYFEEWGVNVLVRLSLDSNHFYDSETDSSSMYQMDIPAGTYEVMAMSQFSGPYVLDTVVVTLDTTVDLVVPVDFTSDTFVFIFDYGSNPALTELEEWEYLRAFKALASMQWWEQEPSRLSEGGEVFARTYYKFIASHDVPVGESWEYAYALYLSHRRDFPVPTNFYPTGYVQCQGANR